MNTKHDNKSNILRFGGLFQGVKSRLLVCLSLIIGCQNVISAQNWSSPASSKQIAVTFVDNEEFMSGDSLNSEPLEAEVAAGHLSKYGIIWSSRYLATFNHPCWEILRTRYQDTIALYYQSAVTTRLESGAYFDYDYINTNHPEWFVKADINQPAGLDNRVRYHTNPDSIYYNRFYLDVANEDFQDWAVTHILPYLSGEKIHLKQPFSGWGMDNVIIGINRLNQITRPYPNWQYANDYDAWHQGIIRYLAKVKTALNQQGFKLIINHTMQYKDIDGMDLYWDAILDSVDGVMSEMPMNYKTLYFYGDRWVYSMQKHEETLNRGKYDWWACYPPKTDQAEHDHVLMYYYCSWLMVNQPGKSFFSAQGLELPRNDNGSTRWYDIYELPIGTPTGPRYQKGNCWIRDYTGAKVVVNNNREQAYITLDSDDYLWKDPDTNQVVQQYTLPAKSGKIFLAVKRNDPPVLQSIPDQNVTTGKLLSFTVTAADQDNDPLVFSVDNLPEGAAFTKNTFTWVPTSQQTGEYSITVTVSDGQEEDNQTVKITVEADNSSSGATLSILPITERSVNEGEMLIIPIGLHYTGNRTLDYTIDNPPAGALMSGNTFVWTPGYNQAGSYAITFTVSDGEIQDSATVQITVIDVPHDSEPENPLTLNPIEHQNVNEGELLIIPLGVTYSGNDAVQFSADNLPEGASLFGNTFVWTPDYDQAGSHVVGFKAQAGESQDSQAVLIRVINVNRAPVLEKIEDQRVTINSSLSLPVAATDPDGDEVTITADNLPEGALFINNTLVWTPHNPLPGEYQVTFTAADGSLQVSKTVNITTIAPTAKDDSRAPVLTQTSPRTGAIQIPLNSLIIMNLADEGSGVDPDSVKITLNDNEIYSGNVARSTSESGVCRRTGTEHNYTYCFQPAKPFEFNQAVTCTIQASDLAGNVMTAQTITFHTEMPTFGRQIPVALGGNSISRGQPRTIRDEQGTIWITWDEGLPAQHQIYITCKSSNDINFGTPVKLAPRLGNQTNPDIAVGNDNRVYVVWQELSSTNWDIYASYSTDGQSWSEPILIDDSPAEQIMPAIAVDNNNEVYITWQDDRNGNQDIFVCSADAQLASINITRVTSNSAQQYDPAIAANPVSGDIYLVWSDDRNGNSDIYGAHAANNWSNTALVSSPGDQTSPVLCLGTNGEDIYLAWVSDNAGNKDILYAQSTGWPEVPLTGIDIIDDTTNSDQTRPSMAVVCDADGRNKIYLSWQDSRNATAENNDIDIYFVEADSQTPTNILITDEASNSRQWLPTLGLDDNDKPYVLWCDYRNGNSDLYYAGMMWYEQMPLAKQEIQAHNGGTVGPEQINTSDDVVVEVPAGALWEDSTMMITRVHNPPSPQGTVETQYGYEFSPSSEWEFGKPVTITIPYEATSANDTSTVYWYNNQDGMLSQKGISNIEVLQITPTLQALRFQTTHFSQYVIAKPAQLNPNDALLRSGRGGCSMARYTPGNDNLADFFLPYVILAMVLLLWRYKARRNTGNSLCDSEHPSSPCNHATCLDQRTYTHHA